MLGAEVVNDKVYVLLGASYEYEIKKAKARSSLVHKSKLTPKVL